jgi:hypothetical protein
VLAWLESLFRTIELLHDKGGKAIHIKPLTALGKYVASDMGNALDCMHGEMRDHLKAAEAGEVQP